MHAGIPFDPQRHRTVLIAGGALIAALVVFATSPRQHVVRNVAVPVVPVSMVIVAQRPIAAGAIIAAADLSAHATRTPPVGALSDVDTAIGRLSDRSIAKGETLLQGNLRDAVGLSARLPQGYRAFSIRVAEDDIVGGFLQSGDHVDMLVTLPGSIFPAKDAQNMPDRSSVLLLAQNVAVLAVGENLATNGAVQSGARTISLALAPEQVARLTLALRLGKVSVAARRPGDDALSSNVNTSLSDLLPYSHAQVAAAPVSRVAAPDHRVPIYAGAGDVTMVAP